MIEETADLNTEENQPVEDSREVEEISDDYKDSDSEDASESPLEDPRLNEEELKTWTPEYISKRYKELRADYTKKTQSLAEQRRELESKVADIESEKQQMQAAVREMLTNPDKLEAYQKIYGNRKGATNQVPQQTMPEINSLDDLTKWVREVVDSENSKILDQVNRERYRERAQLADEQQWDVACNEFKSDPYFSDPNFQNLIVEVVRNDAPKYRADLAKGKVTRQEIIRKGIDKFKGMLKPHLEKARNDGAGFSAKKKRSSTEMPAKGGVVTEPSRKLTKEEIIARVESQLGG